MTQYVALLRGINVGGRVVSMADLKACFEGLGFTDVTTLLQSGNVIFDSNSQDIPALRAQIEAAVAQRFSYPTRILIYPIRTIRKAVQAYPFDTSDTAKQHYLIFIAPNLVPALASDTGTLDPQIERIASGDGVLYWTVQKGMTLKSAFSKRLTKATYKDHHTVRNINTLQKIITKTLP